MKNCKKNEKGVTMIVLVVTITITLILAAVSVKIATGSEKDNGVIQRTSKQRHEQFNMVSNQQKSINDVINNEISGDWGY